MLEPYEQRLGATKRERRRWAAVVAGAIEARHGRDVQLLMLAGKEYTISQTIAELEEQLDPNLFVRVHRATLVNVKQIKEIQVWFGGKYRLVLADKEGSQVVVSKIMAKRLKSVIPF